jgi:hypothetical protein
LVKAGEQERQLARNYDAIKLRDWLCLAKAELEELRKNAKAAKAGQ